jgi:hypothetical protein
MAKLSQALSSDFSTLPLREQTKQIKTPELAREAQANVLEQQQAGYKKLADMEAQAGVTAAEEKAKPIEAYAQGATEDIQKSKEEKEKLPFPEFHPTQDNAQSLMELFSVLNVVGMAMGALGKNNALGAMKSMTGMMKGYREGRKDLFEREKVEFDKNFQAMKTKHEEIAKDLEQALKVRAIDKEKGDAMANIAIAKAQSPILTEKYNLQGLVPAAELYKQIGDTMDKQNEKIEQRAFDLKKIELEHQNRLKEKAAAEGGSSKGLQSKLIMQNVIGAGNEVVTSMDAVMRLKAGTTAGLMPYISSKEGMMNFIRSGAARKFSSDDAKVINTFYTGLKRNLATIEAAGRSQGLVGLTSSIGDIQPMVGDDALTVAAKFAETRKIVEATLQPLADSGLMDTQQAAGARKVVDSIRKIIPYDINDIAEATNKSGTSLGESASRAAVSGKSTFSDADEKRLKELEAKSNGS